MHWTLPNDTTTPVITAHKHIQSSHGDKNIGTLPETCVLFEMGKSLSFIKAEREAIILTEHLPCFIADSECIVLKSHPEVCFVKGGYGAPAAVDTLETIIAMGVKQIIVAGLCGGFVQHINVGDVIVPRKIYCEEGTSHHYYEDITFSEPDPRLWTAAIQHFEGKFTASSEPTVTSDSFYRQTYGKEVFWRQQGIVGVDMESSAILSVSRFYGVPAVSVMLCSDKHPLDENEIGWQWGNCDFDAIRKSFVDRVVEFACLTKRACFEKS